MVASDPVNGSVNPKAIPGAQIVYSTTIQNTGPSTVDNNSLFIVDVLPAQIRVGTAASPTFVQGTPSSGLTLTPSSDIRFSNSATAPTSFASCNYTPTSAYDPAVRFVCINPKGVMAGSSGSPPSFTVAFRSQLQ